MSTTVKLEETTVDGGFQYSPATELRLQFQLPETPDQHPSSPDRDYESICWGCGLRLILPSNAPVFKCGWCGAITKQDECKSEKKSLWWRRLRDRCFVVLLFIFMIFVICGGVWAVYPILFSVSYLCGLFHCMLAFILGVCTLSTFSLAAFCNPGTPLPIMWGSYPAVRKDELRDFTFCHYCSQPKSPRTHHCSSCGMCVLDMDHHCPFIGNCVGSANHRYFISFLIVAVISVTYVSFMSAYAILHMSPSLGETTIDQMHRVGNKLAVMGILKDVFIAKARLELIQTQLTQNPGNEGLRILESAAAKEYLEFNEAAMNFLAQKAKVEWIKGGDMNSKFFHNVIRSRVSRNQVFSVKDMHGVVQEDPQLMQQAFLEYYIHLLGTEVSTTAVNKQLIEQGAVCSEAHKHILLRSVTREEIKAAIFDIPNQKAPGPDGFSSAFYKDSWSIIGDDVCEAIQDVFSSGRLLKQVNATIITLVPKVKVPQSVTQYRPIACCNVLYKCVSKLLCNRLALVLPDLVSNTQGGFIRDRSIMENILICQDLVRLYSRQACSPRCMFKIDLMKAYDSVSWGFVGELLDALQFPSSVRSLIMECVTTPSFSLAINGEVFGFFQGKRGLRQGDPISPLLFTLCMEYLSRILKFATENLKFTYHPLCKSMKLSHLMFADDLLLFSKGDAPSILVLLRSFSSFSLASGLKNSPQKSCVYFNGVANSLKAEILSISGYVEGKLPFRYLGVPITAGRLKSTECAILIDRMVERIRQVGARKLSYSGRLVLVQSVLQTLHSYWASMFLLPKGVMEKVEAICRNYLWGGGADYVKNPSVAWAKVCNPKSAGGLNLKDGSRWNMALVGKLVWWMAVKADRLWVQWMNHVYLKGVNWYAFNPKSDTSWYVKRICKVKDRLASVFQDGVWSINNGLFTVDSCYRWLGGHEMKVAWYRAIWHPLVEPKHSFIAWMVAHRGLKTKDKLHTMGICADDTCCICGMCSESHIHLLTGCSYALKILELVNNWLRIRLEGNELLEGVQSRRWSKTKKIVVNAVRAAVVYAIWKQRNEAWQEQRILLPQVILKNIQSWIRGRTLHTDHGCKLIDSVWLNSIGC